MRTSVACLCLSSCCTTRIRGCVRVSRRSENESCSRGMECMPSFPGSSCCITGQKSLPFPRRRRDSHSLHSFHYSIINKSASLIHSEFSSFLSTTQTPPVDPMPASDRQERLLFALHSDDVTVTFKCSFLSLSFRENRKSSFWRPSPFLPSLTRSMVHSLEPLNQGLRDLRFEPQSREDGRIFRPRNRMRHAIEIRTREKSTSFTTTSK